MHETLANACRGTAWLCWYGHSGSGGSMAFGDPDAKVGFGYVTNLWSFRIGEPRAVELGAVVECLG